MVRRALRKENDYNRGLPAPIRWLRLALTPLGAVCTPVWRWSGRGARVHWARPLLWGLIAATLLWAFDAWLLGGLVAFREWLGGDIVREWSVLQQFGQGGSIVLIAIVIALMDRRRAGRLWDWLAGIVLTAAAVYPLKMLAGRPRPGLGREPGGSITDGMYSADTFLGPLGKHPFDEPTGLRHAWEFWADISADLWSMPSAHTAYAVVAGVFLGAMYPPLRWLLVAVVSLVGVGRVAFGAHYPTDVAIGAAIGFAAGLSAVRLGLGTRAVATLRRSSRGTPDAPAAPDATPAAPSPL
ncbi:MAG: phosphatase PAP2 family protein [Phycisphaerales bacterium]|nr:phosphatase PAP2 family protein [Phycisphaerales bacterium]MCB9840071.1 phosphatase PAP2 family protein [Phycisphaeraceae bacterium]